MTPKRPPRLFVVYRLCACCLNVSLLGLLLLLAPLFAQVNQLSPAEEAAGWQLLFDGTTQDGWQSDNLSRPDWVIDDDALRNNFNGDLCTEALYGNFELKVYWRINTGGNSGIFWRVRPGVVPVYHSGPEYAIVDKEEHPDGAEADKTTGALYDFTAPSLDVENPIGEYNTSVVWLEGTHVEHWLNGAKVAEIEMYSQEWDDKLAASKFSQPPFDPDVFAQDSTGLICLQDHGSPLMAWFRNIKIRTFNPGEPLPAPFISPPGAAFDDSLEVSLEAAVTGASVHYTTDGSDPDENSTPYTGPFVIRQTANVRAITVRENFETSEISGVSFTRNGVGVRASPSYQTLLQQIVPGKNLIPVSEPVQFRLYDTGGNLLISARSNQGYLSFELRGREPGVYFMVITQGTNQFQRLMVLE